MTLQEAIEIYPDAKKFSIGKDFISENSPLRHYKTEEPAYLPGNRRMQIATIVCFETLADEFMKTKGDHDDRKSHTK